MVLLAYEVLGRQRRGRPLQLGAFSTRGPGASEQCEHGGNTGRLLCLVRYSGGMVEDVFEGDKTWRQEALEES